MGDRTPYSGDGYCGLLIEYCFNPNGICDYGWWIEYVQSELSNELKSGYEYLFQCHVSLTNKLFAQYAYSKFGASFTASQITRSDAKSFEFIPQIFNGATNHLQDTNWVELSGTFIAQGGEKYITLGFFIDTLNPDTLIRPENVDPIADWFYNSYYFIDNIVLVETGNVTNFPNVFTPNSDGKNDTWSPLYLYINEIIYIYNRWGNLVYILNSENNKWNGKTLTGDLCVDGVYFFSSTYDRRGTIQLINNTQ
jgi:gliding motility-associated-like protein